MNWRCSIVVLTLAGMIIAALMRLEQRIYESYHAVVAAALDLADVSHEIRGLLRNIE